MDLIGGYLLVILILFTVNISLLVGNFNINAVKSIVVSVIYFIATFTLLNASVYLNNALLFLSYDFSYLFFIIFAIIFIVMAYYSKTSNIKATLCSISLSYLISVIALSSQTDLGIIGMILYSLLVFIIFFVVYQLSKLLHHAKRQYSVIIGEYMCLASILMLIFALTYNSVINLDYTMFTPFLILTPTYQLIYVVIAIIVVLIIGVFVNDSRGGIL